MAHKKGVATLPCEMFVLKNRYIPQPSEAICRTSVSHSKQLLKKIFIQWCLLPFCSLAKRYLQ